MLIDQGKEIFKEQNLSMLLKRTKAKGWNRKIGILVGPRPSVAYLNEHEKELAEHSGIDLDYFELKKKKEKEGDIEAQCIVVYAVDEAAESFDLALRNMVSEKMDNLTCYSFANGSSEQRKQALTFNRLQNVKMKCEIMRNARVREMVKKDGVKITLRKALTEVKIDDEVIFQAIEQGYGDVNKHVFVCYHPEHRKLVMQWFQKEFMKGIQLEHQRTLETSIMQQTSEQQHYQNKVDQHLSRAIAAKKSSLETLPLCHSTVTYASVAKGVKSTHNTNENDNVSMMTENSIDNEEKETTKKEKEISELKNDKDNDSMNDQGSVWSKESVINQIKLLTNELEHERQERQKERQERIKEKEENSVAIENMKQMQQMFLSINENDTDEEVGSQVKGLIRKMKKSASKNKATVNENKNQGQSRLTEIDNEINQLNAAGLQSPPFQNKSDSSKFASHSEKTEKR